VQAVLFKLLGSFRGEFPRYAILGKLLYRGSQLGLVEREIIYTAYMQDTYTRESCTDVIHERAARGTEVVGYGVVLAGSFYENSARLTEGLQAVAAAQVLQVRIVDREISCMHGCGELVAIRAVADERANKTRAMC
jgi:hypothetical protein